MLEDGSTRSDLHLHANRLNGQCPDCELLGRRDRDLWRRRADYTQSGADSFTATTGTITHWCGNSTATVTLDPIVDTTVEDNETAILTVTAGGGYSRATHAERSHRHDHQRR